MQIYLPVPPDETFASPAGADDYENKIDPCSTRFSNETGGWGRGVFGEGRRGERRIDGCIKARQRRNEGGSFFVLSDAFEISPSTTPPVSVSAVYTRLIYPQVTGSAMSLLSRVWNLVSFPYACRLKSI